MRMHRFVGSVVALVLVTGFVGVLTAQSDECAAPGDWERCGLVAAGFDGTPPSGVVRQVVMINRSGPPHVPHSGLLLRESADSVWGEVFELWPARMAHDSGVVARCGERWSNAHGLLCLTRRAVSPDWAALRDSLDRLDFAMMPARPAPPARCDAAGKEVVVIPTGKGQRNGNDQVISGTFQTAPEQYHCGMTFDGPSLEIRTWHYGAHWSYRLDLQGDSSSAEWRRDEAVLGWFRGVFGKPM